MSMWDIEMELAAANPAPAERIAGLPLAEAERELLREIATEPTRAPRRIPRARRRHVALLAGALAAAAVVIAVVGGSDRRGKPEPAFAAELVRFAERSPLLLIDQPGWKVSYADEETAIEGEMRFRHPGRGMAELHWRAGSLREWKSDRAGDAVRASNGQVLGTTAAIYAYDAHDITALWLDRGRVLEFRAGVPNLATFKQLLASLTRVDTTAWLSAMPASVVKAGDQNAAVRDMLRGIPLPPGFDASKIKTEGLTKDRYQLGANVVSAVACDWFARWDRARRAGDQRGVREAIAAMRTAQRWPILREMAKQGAYPDVLEGFVKAMPSGRWYGRPLAGDVNSGLGCSLGR